MARTDTLDHFLTDVADSIRTKGGTQATIDADDFDTAIAALPSGGGGDEAHPDFVSFYGYPGNTLDISWLRTDNMTDLNSTFKACPHLTSIDVSNFDTSNVTSMISTFQECNVLGTIIGLDQWDTSNVTTMNSMICSNAAGLTSFHLDFDLSSCTDMGSMFYNDTVLSTFTFATGLDTSVLKTVTSMFNNCTELTTIDLTNFDLSNVEYINDMFNYCIKLTSVTFGNYNLNKVKTLNSLFSNCTLLTTITNFPLITSNTCTSTSAMFYGCTGLTTLDLSNFKTQALRTMTSMFANCSNLTSINLCNVNTNVNTNYGNNMFTGCTSLTHLDMRSYDLHKVTTRTNMFGSSASDGPPDNCEIIVKDNNSKQWFTAYFPRFTNVKTVDEL